MIRYKSTAGSVSFATSGSRASVKRRPKRRRRLRQGRRIRAYAGPSPVSANSSTRRRSSSRVARKAAIASSAPPLAAAGSAMSQCRRRAFPREGRACLSRRVAEGDHVMETAANVLVHRLGPLMRDVDAYLAHSRQGILCEILRQRAGAMHLEAISCQIA